MVQVGQRVQVRAGGRFAPVWYGRTGRAVEDHGSLGLIVNMDPVEPTDSDDRGVLFYVDELIVLGGKHAGQPHPDNMTTVTAYTRNDVWWSVLNAETYGKHAGPADYEAEVDAWQAEQGYL